MNCSEWFNSSKISFCFDSTDEGIDICVNDKQQANVPLSINVDEEFPSKNISFNDVNWRKAHSIITQIDDEILILANDKHPKNAYHSIIFTEEGMFILANVWQNSKQTNLVIIIFQLM